MSPDQDSAIRTRANTIQDASAGGYGASVTFADQSGRRSEKPFDPYDIDLYDAEFDSQSEYYDSEEERQLEIEEAKNKGADGALVDAEAEYRRWL